MANLWDCFVPELKEPVQVLHAGQRMHRSLDCYKLNDLNTCLNHGTDENCSNVVISICQRNSWAPLQITQEMLDFIFSQYDINSSVFGDLPSSFYRRHKAIEEGFCIPFTQWIRGTRTDISYTIRYPEFKEQTGEWVIRQTGVYHRFDTSTQRSLYLLFNPLRRSKFHQRVVEAMASCAATEADPNPLWLHELLFSTYLPAWRQYIAEQEHQFLNIRNLTFVTFIDEPLRLGYDNLSALVSLENRFRQIPAMLQYAMDILDGLGTLFKEDESLECGLSQSERLPQHSSLLDWHKSRCSAYSRTAEYLQQRTQSTAQLLNSTLSLRDQKVAKEQTDIMLYLNKSVVFITILTLFYLPASFLSVGTPR